MALRDRVLILPDGTFKASNNGFDVNTADLEQMAFDARFAAIGMAQAGTLHLPNRGSLVSKATNTRVELGRTFTSPPMFIFGWKTNGPAGTTMLVPRIVSYHPVQNNQQIQVNAKVTEDAVVFSNWYADGNIQVYWKALA